MNKTRALVLTIFNDGAYMTLKPIILAPQLI